MRQSLLFLIIDCLFAIAMVVAESQTGSDATNAADQAGQNDATAVQETQNLPGTAAQERVPQTQPAPGLRREQQRMSNYGTFRERPWFDNPTVREQLGLNDDQFNDLNRSYGSAYDRYRRRMAELNDLDATQRRERLREYRREFDNTFSESLDRVLTDRQRRNRYNQLDYQYRNYNAFNNPTVRQQLDLTPQQRRLLSRYSRAWNDDMRRLERTHASSPDLVSRQYRQLQDRYWDQIGSLLNEQQLRSWQGMTGDRYDFPPETYWNQEPSRTANQNSNPTTAPRNSTPQ